MPTLTVHVHDLPLSTANYNRSRRGIRLLKAAIKELEAIPATSDDRLVHDMSANQAHRFASALDSIYCLMLCSSQKPFQLLPAVEWSLRHALIDD